MSERFLSPLIKYTTSTLKTLPGAKLYFYRANTTTPAVVYQDVGLITPHAHPVVASSDGTFPEIFLSGTYNVLLTSADDVVQPGWPIDYVGGNQSGFSFDLWNPALNYAVGDLVTHTNGLRYQSRQTPNINRAPDEEPGYWREVRFFDDWNSISVYSEGETVFHDGLTWVSTEDDNQNNEPVDGSQFWKAAFVNPMTTAGDIIIGGSDGGEERLPIGADNYVLTSTGATAAWEDPLDGVVGDAITAVANNLTTVSNKLNKQIIAPIQTFQNLGSVTGTVTIDLNLGTIINLTASGNITIEFTLPAEHTSSTITLAVVNITRTTQTVTHPLGTIWSPNGIAPTLTDNGTDTITYTKSGSDVWNAVRSREDIR